MRSVYIIGSAGAGKSTFTSQLLEDWELGPHIDMYTVFNSIGRPEILRGHLLTRYGSSVSEGFYLGRMRPGNHPGTDGLSRSTVIAGEAWLRAPLERPRFLIGEGATFATKGFLGTLAETTELLLVHLIVDPEVLTARFAERGTNQDPKFVQATQTRSDNTASRMRAAGTRVLTVDSADSAAWETALDLCQLHLHREPS